MGRHIAAVAAAGIVGLKVLQHAPAPAVARQLGSSASVPATLGTEIAKNVPVYVNAIDSVHAYNVKSRVKSPIVAVDFQRGRGGQTGPQPEPGRSA